MGCGREPCLMSTAGTCNAIGCPNSCNPAGPAMVTWPRPYSPPAPVFYPVQAGCICPPTSEKTCGNPSLPKTKSIQAWGHRR